MRIHDSQAHRNMDVTRERISRYAIGLPKTVSKLALLCWCSSGSKFVADSQIVADLSDITAHKD